MNSIDISNVTKLDDCKQKIDDLLTYYEKSKYQKSLVNKTLINAASQSLQIN